MKIPRCFYYITHKDNLKSILKNGIWSRSRVTRNPFFRIFTPKIKSIHAEDVIQIRKKKTFKGRPLWDYANVYFQPRNPMLYRVIQEYKEENIVILQINSDIINNSSVGITDGNAASQETTFFDNISEGLNVLSRDQFERQYWNEEVDLKRKIMAEALIYEHIPKEKIMGIFTANQQTSDYIRREITGPLNIMLNPKMFFLPDYSKRISKYISLKKGDMFFSKMKVFTISVNTVGVMGKGLASRAKYQFPNVYVRYQDLCRQKKLKMGIPFLYTKEKCFEKDLMEDTKVVETENGNRWFLLFPTKNHWKTDSPIDGIEQGLQWLKDNYKKLDIPSIALPALGCGLGGLSWKEVGALMCKYLNQMDIQSEIYLPLETQIPDEQLNPGFLLKKPNLS